MARKALLLAGFGLALAFAPHGAQAATLDASCGCEGQIAEPVASALSGLEGEALANRIASLLAGNADLAQDVVCGARGLEADNVEAVAIGLARGGLTMDQVEAWVCCSDPGLLAVFASISADDGNVANVSTEAPRCVRAARAGVTQFITRGFSATSGGGAVSPSEP